MFDLGFSWRDKRDSMHTWTEADCTTAKNCSVCGATEGSALGHEWTTPDVDLCEVQSTCSRCGATDGENKKHSPAEDDGNCLTAITCSVCGTTTTPAKESHTSGTATCTEKAICTACGTAYGTVDANNHIDENTDHICDRECGMKDIGTHADSAEDNDHVCDYGCGEALNDHEGGAEQTCKGYQCDICSEWYGEKNKNHDYDDHICTKCGNPAAQITGTAVNDDFSVTFFVEHDDHYLPWDALQFVVYNGDQIIPLDINYIGVERPYATMTGLNPDCKGITLTAEIVIAGFHTDHEKTMATVEVKNPDNHTVENHVCTACGAMEIVVSFDAGDFEWKTGDELYFCRVSRDNQWEEYCFTATVDEDATVTWTPDKSLYWDGTGEHRLFVSYPCTAVGWDDFMIPTDQSDADKLKEADCMNARLVGTPTTNVIEFELKHRMAKITVNYSIASQFDFDALVIAEIYSNAMYCKFRDADGLPIITSVGQYDAWITPYNNDNQFTVYVAPGEYNTDGMFKFYIGDAEVQIEITNPGAVTLEEGGNYTFNVKVGQDVLTIEEVSMGDIDSPFGYGWHNEIDLRAIGTQDVGKTAWEMGDQIIVTFTSPSLGTQYGTLTYNGTVWSTDVSFSYLEGETPTVSAIYAPCYEVVDGNVHLKDGMQLGMTEYISAACSVTDGTLNISFEGATRNYSRLRISALPAQTLTVTTTGFTPAGATEAATEAYTLTADENGNIYLYGTFAEGATVSVKQGEVTLADYTFTAEKHPEGAKPGINYALDARPIIDGTLGGKTEATEEDINALVEQLKAYMDNGITTIIVMGEEPAVIEVNGIIMPAVSEAIYRLSDPSYGENNPYNGKIDLILQDVRKIMEWEFCGATALNSITLPKVTTIGDSAFYGCTYLKQITFGSVVTSIVQENRINFYLVGYDVGGCDLVLNCGQLQTEDTYKPDLENNVWFKPSWGGNVTWKSISLTHTGECDECKAQ